MTDIPTIARNNACNCEAIKYAYRQTREGVVVSFVIHPSDIPPALQVSPIGARYVLALVELDDTEQPKEAAPDRKVTKKPAPDDAPARARKSDPEKRLVKQAVMCTGDPVFRKFLDEHSLLQAEDTLGDGITWEDVTRATIYDICGVSSRAAILPGTHAGQVWDALYSKFVAWKLAA